MWISFKLGFTILASYSTSPDLICKILRMSSPCLNLFWGPHNLQGKVWTLQPDTSPSCLASAPFSRLIPCHPHHTPTLEISRKTCCSWKSPEPSTCSPQHPGLPPPPTATLPSPPSPSPVGCPMGSCPFLHDSSVITSWWSHPYPSTLSSSWQTETFYFFSYEAYLCNIFTLKNLLVLYISSHIRWKIFEHLEHVLFVWIFSLRDSRWSINVFWMKWIWLWMTRI